MKLEQSEREFEDITKNIRIEIRRFELHRTKEFKKILTQHIEALIAHEQEVLLICVNFVCQMHVYVVFNVCQWCANFVRQ